MNKSNALEFLQQCVDNAGISVYKQSLELIRKELEGNPKNSGKKEEAASPTRGVQQTKFPIFELYELYCKDNKLSNEKVIGARRFMQWLENNKHL